MILQCIEFCVGNAKFYECQQHAIRTFSENDKRMIRQFFEWLAVHVWLHQRTAVRP